MPKTGSDISRIKLEALAEQHKRLEAHYKSLREQSRTCVGELEILKLFHEGLAELSFAGQPLHPETLSLEAVLLEAEMGSASDGLVKQWIDRLSQELIYGQRRAEFAHLFGGLLNEWAQSGKRAPKPPGAEAFNNLYLETIAASAPPPSMASLKGFFETYAEALSPVLAGMAHVGASLAQPVGRDELKAHLQMFTVNPDTDARLRIAARAVHGDDLQVDDHAGAMTVLLNQDPEEWRWPSAPKLRTIWRRDRFRAYFDTNLVNALQLEIIGQRLAIELKGRLLNTWPLNLRGKGVNQYATSIDNAHAQKANQLFLPSTPIHLSELTRLGASESIQYEGFKFTDETPDALQQLLSLIAADIDLAQKTGAEALYVAHIDIKDYFISIPHEVAVGLLELLGLPAPWCAFIKRVLQVPLPEASHAAHAKRGLPLNLRLSYLISDTLLRVMDAIVHQESGVRPVRFMDDIYFVATDKAQAETAIKTIHTFLRDCGLQPNPEKSGSVTLAGEHLDTLPEGKLNWGFLALLEDGSWAPKAEALKDYGAHIRASIERAPSILEKVAEYNIGLNYLLRGLAPFTNLASKFGEQRARTARALAEFTKTHFPNEGFTSHLKSLIRERFKDTLSEDAEILDAALYWPITAGGLGVCNPLVVLASIGKANTIAPPDKPPSKTNWRFESGAWHNYYSSRLSTLAPTSPRTSPAMQGLRNEFISRGQRLMNNRTMASLTSYWEWMIQSYGPQLVAHFGAFSFLLNELVPMQLVVQSRKITSSLDEELVSTQRNFTAFADDIPF